MPYFQLDIGQLAFEMELNLTLEAGLLLDLTVNFCVTGSHISAACMASLSVKIAAYGCRPPPG